MTDYSAYQSLCKGSWEDNILHLLTISQQLYACHFLKALSFFVLTLRELRQFPKVKAIQCQSWKLNLTVPPSAPATPPPCLKMTATSLQTLTLKYECEKISGSSQFSDKGTRNYMAPQILR
jgi:hypothetical protein